MKRIRTITATILAGTIAVTSALPARSQPQALIAPAVCATGVGCIFLGVVTAGGIAYYVWQNNQTGKTYHVPIEDPEEEMRDMGTNAQNGRIVLARSASEAHSRCQQWAGKGRRTAAPTKLGTKPNGTSRYRCVYY